MERDKIREQFQQEKNTSFDGISINGVHLEYIEWLENKLTLNYVNNKFEIQQQVLIFSIVEDLIHEYSFKKLTARSKPNKLDVVGYQFKINGLIEFKRELHNEIGIKTAHEIFSAFQKKILHKAETALKENQSNLHYELMQKNIALTEANIAYCQKIKEYNSEDEDYGDFFF